MLYDSPRRRSRDEGFYKISRPVRWQDYALSVLQEYTILCLWRTSLYPCQCTTQWLRERSDPTGHQSQRLPLQHSQFLGISTVLFPISCHGVVLYLTAHCYHHIRQCFRVGAGSPHDSERGAGAHQSLGQRAVCCASANPQVTKTFPASTRGSAVRQVGMQSEPQVTSYSPRIVKFNHANLSLLNCFHACRRYARMRPGTLT